MKIRRRSGSKKNSDEDGRTALPRRPRLHRRLLDRLDEFIAYQTLGPNELEGVVRLQLEGLCLAATGWGIDFEWDRSVIEYFVQVVEEPGAGSQELKHRLGSDLEALLEEGVIAGTFLAGDCVRAMVDPQSGMLRLSKTKRSAPARAA